MFTAKYKGSISYAVLAGIMASTMIGVAMSNYIKINQNKAMMLNFKENENKARKAITNIVKQMVEAKKAYPLPQNIITNNTNLRDAWGSNFVYCPYIYNVQKTGYFNLNRTPDESSTAFSIISGGPNKTVETVCEDAASVSKNDDIVYHVSFSDLKNNAQIVLKADVLKKEAYAQQLPANDGAVATSLDTGAVLIKSGSQWIPFFQDNGSTTNSAVVNNKTVELHANNLLGTICFIGGTSKKLFCYGDNRYNKISDISVSRIYVPQKITLPGDNDVISVNVHVGRVCALDSVGDVYCWGSNAYYANGNGLGTGSVPVSAPYKVQIPEPVVKLFGNDETRHEPTCALTTANKVYCWGYLYGGEDPSKYTDILKIPTEITELSGAEDAYLSRGVLYEKTPLGDLIAHGVNFYSKKALGLSNGTLSSIYYAPENKVSLNGKLVDFSTNQYNSCAVRDDGAVFCWGFNYGLRTFPKLSGNYYVTFPLESGSVKMKKIAYNGAGYCGISKSGDEIYCFGGNVGVKNWPTGEISTNFVKVDLKQKGKKFYEIPGALCLEDFNTNIYCINGSFYKPNETTTTYAAKTFEFLLNRNNY